MTRRAGLEWIGVVALLCAGGCSRAIDMLGDSPGGPPGSGIDDGSAGSGGSVQGGGASGAGAGAGSGVAGGGFAGSGGFAGGVGVAGGAGTAGGAGSFAGSAGAAGSTGGVGGGFAGGGGSLAGTGAAGIAGGGDFMCDDTGTCYGPDGTVCYSNGTCCYPDGRCCNDALGFCSGPGVPPPPLPPIAGAPFPFPPQPVPTEPPLTDEPWDPPFDLGDDGWRDSTDPLCTEEQGYIHSNSVWSDSRGVFALVGGEGGEYYGPGFPPGFPFPFPFPMDPFFGCFDGYCSFERVYFNDGTGWSEYYELAPPTDPNTYRYVGQKQMTGFDGGKLVLYGYEEGQELCGLSMLDSVSRECEPVWEVSHVFVVDSDLAYGILEGNIIHYDGDRWGPLPSAPTLNQDLRRLWANDTDVFATGWGAGRIYHLTEMGWSLEDTRTLEQFSSLWGFASDDLWAGTEQGGLYHFDGTIWNELEWEHPATCQDRYVGVSGMWGADGVLYFYTGNALARVEDGNVEVLAEWPCVDYEPGPRITSIWGNAPDEVFIAVQDDRLPRQECGVTFLIYYDGSEFHRF